MTSKFQQRHYEAIAELMQDAREYAPRADSVTSDYREGYDDAIGFLETKMRIVFGNDNPMFDAARFSRACKPGANVRGRS